MLHHAVQSHGARSSQQGGVQGYLRKPLDPITPGALNGERKVEEQRRGFTTGIKRTSDGLAKAVAGSFEDDGVSHSQIYATRTDTGKGLASKNTTSDLYDENEFDSDVDLEIDDPTSRRLDSTIKYPSLPKAPPQLGTTSRFLSPTTPRSQSMQAGAVKRSSGSDSGYLSPGFSNPPHQVPSSSGGAIPWSSSPVEHLAPRQTNFNLYKNNEPRVAPAKEQMKAPPTQKRPIPWETSKITSKPTSVIDRDASKRAETKHTVKSTPAARTKKLDMVMSPWNTSQSAMKEQVKKHREEARKATVRVNAATEEDLQKAMSARSRPAKVFLSDEQQHVLDLVIEKKCSVFFTGSAGTGKSVLMREVISSLRKKFARESDRIAVTASTGLAACNVGGVTLHSFAGFGLGKEDVPALVKKIKRNQKAKQRWMRTQVLIIDEVSMVDAELFDKLEAIARQLRNNGRPFGGIQLVITGDFFQLPPVPDSGRVAKFAFDAATWSTTIQHTIGLHQVFRQKDPIFAGMLNEMREGRLTESSIKAFRNLSRDLEFQDSIVATELFPTRQEVERANSNRLSLLQGRDMVYQAVDGGTIQDKVQRDKLLANCMAPETILLKKGAQVMLIKNVDESLVNGSLGRVYGFMSEARFDSYQRHDEDSSDPAANNHPDLGQFLEERAAHRGGYGVSTAKEYPVIRFGMADGTTRDMLCQPEQWKVELPNGEVQASRSQIPLILAWALSIHKAQGQTLDRVKVDLGKVFEKGQAYVALSRATSMGGLQVLRFDPKKVIAHERVRSFYSNLSRVETSEGGDARGKIVAAKKSGVHADDYEKRFVGQ